MNGLAPQRSTGRLIVGSLLILFGVIFLLDNLGFLDAGDLLDHWPLILIAIGTLKVLQPRPEGQRAFGVGLLALGIFFELQVLAFVTLGFEDIWPVILVAIGAVLLWRGLGRRKERTVSPDSVSSLSEFAFMGGVNRVVESPDFRGGEATAVMGAVELDLRGSTIVNSPAIVDVFALWGGIELTVPQEWRVDVKGTPILGGFENKVRSSGRDAGAPEQVLVVRGTAIMGGVEIKN